MKIDIVYIGNELIINLSGNYKSEDLLEVERRIDIILNDYDISNIKFNTDNVINLNKKNFNYLVEKYYRKLKEA